MEIPMKKTELFGIIAELALVGGVLFATELGSKGPADFPVFQGPFFGRKPPGVAAEIFAPGAVSTGLEEGAMTFAPDGLECLWTVTLSGAETIVMSRFENGRWTEPEVAPFAGRYLDGWPAFRPDGKRMFFHSSRPLPEKSAGPTAEINIWYIDRTGNGWSEPRPVGAPVNGSENAACPSVTKDGTLYLSKRFSDKSEKICRARWADGRFQELEVLPAVINTTNDNFHAVISPDESYLLRPQYGRKDALGGGWNYYVSFRGDDGNWSDLINLGPGVNSARCGGTPTISVDGRYLFLQIQTPVEWILDRKQQFSLKELVDREIRFPSAGGYDIYWVDAKIIQDLKAKIQK